MASHAKKREMARTCPTCGAGFITGSSIKVHCSAECRVRDAAKAFGHSDSCWEWQGSRNPVSGYGQMSEWVNGGRKLYTAHRVSYQAFHGAIPAGQQVLHRCDNRPCFNPAHLFLGDQLANVRDMISKGRALHRTPVGSAHHATKITETDVIAIRASTDKLEVLAQRYGMSTSALCAIRAGRTWRHV